MTRIAAAVVHDPADNPRAVIGGNRPPIEEQVVIDPADALIAEILGLRTVDEVNAFISDADLSLLDDDQAARVREEAAAHSELIKRAMANAARGGATD